MLQRFKTFVIVFTSTISLLFAQQKGKVAGKVEDAGTSEELIGVAVGIKGTSQGTSTDIEGRYMLNLEPGTYTLVFGYVGYKTQEITDVVVTSGQVLNLNIALKEEVSELEEVVVTYKAEQASTDALMLERKNSVTVSDGLSAELIKKTPDRSTSDVLKRVTGASIQDGKFAIIRGLNDRYNASFLNGAPLPSTEADRKAFSFDIFPANLLDNITITKTATPDQTGDFAGGVINLTTKDIPDQWFVDASVGGSHNSIATGNTFYKLPKGKNEWLGLDNGYRQVPGGVPDDKSTVWTATGLAGRAGRAEQADLFQNNWGRMTRTTALFGDKLSPGYNFQLSAGTPIRKNFGVVAAVTYRRGFTIRQQERNRLRDQEEYIDAPPNYEQRTYSDQYIDNVSAGAMLNFGVKINEFNKVSLKNTANVLSEDMFLVQKLDNYDGTRIDVKEKGTQNIFTSSILFNNQLTGEHFLPSSKIKLNWVASQSFIERDIPDFKRLKFTETTDGAFNKVNLFSNLVNEESGSRLWSKSSETIKSFTYSLNRDFTTGFVKTNIKVGAYHQYRDRTVKSRMFGMAFFNNNANRPSDSLLQLPEHLIFDPANTKESKGFFLENYTQTYKWNYTANSLINAAYFMFDHKIFDFRIIWGVRFESFSPRLSGFTSQDTPLKRDTTIYDKLPSLNIVYSFSNKSNLRFAYSQTINRPEFREFSTFSFYDPINQLSLVGNPNLVRAYVYNTDIRYEFFPGAGQVIAFTGFYKRFENPIENVYNDVEKAIRYQNARAANCYGVELEFRQNLQSIFRTSGAKVLSYTTLFANLALVNSRVDLSSTSSAAVANERPLQGQSPYVLNGGILFNNPDKNYSVNLSYNKVGRRLYLVGSEVQGIGVPDVYENPRDVVDIQLAKSFKFKFTGKSMVELKLNINDLLAQDYVFYQDFDKNGKFSAEKDPIFNKLTVGRNVSLSLGLKF